MCGLSANYGQKRFNQRPDLQACSAARRCLGSKPTLSSIASFTMRTESSSPARACANGACPNHPLDPATKGILRQHTGFGVAGRCGFTIAPLEYTGAHDPCMLPDSAVADILFSR